MISYSAINEADLWADDIRDEAGALNFNLHIGEDSWPVTSPLHGLYNVSNALAAIGAACLALGVPVATAIEALAEVPGIAGRMENINLGQDFKAIVDFAHTPNAMERALQTARAQTQGRVIAVFGSAGLCATARNGA